jgi:hypothetical protein
MRVQVLTVASMNMSVYGLLCRVVSLKLTDVSEVLTTYFYGDDDCLLVFALCRRLDIALMMDAVRNCNVGKFLREYLN